MLLLLMAAVIAGALAASEREPHRVAFAAALFAALAGAFALILGDLERALVLCALVFIAIEAVSRVKHHHSGRKLIAADVPLLFAGTVPFMMTQYRRTMILILSGTASLVLATGVCLASTGGPALATGTRGALLAVAVCVGVLVHRLAGGADAFTRGIEQPHGFVSTYLASLLDYPTWRASGGLRLSDIAEEPLPLLSAVPARVQRLPDIIIIQHESVFDPRVYGLPVGDDVAAFLSPAGGLNGTLNVDIFGGGSWQSEFSLVTGLSSMSFGNDAYFLLERGVGRFHHTLPRSLTSLGYRNLLLSSCRRGFLNYDAYYRSKGFDERVFSDDLLSRDALETFEQTHSDTIFLDAVRRAYSERLASDPAPRFAYVLTNFNHGPHDRHLAAADYRQAHAPAVTAMPDPQYAEYYARLSETAAAWTATRARLLTDFPDRPILVLHYGDHQPVMARGIEKRLRLPADGRRAFRTFYAIEGLNFAPDLSSLRLPSELDIAFLGTVAMQAAGVPLDAVTATRASLIDACGSAYFASASPRKRGFHRTLVEMGLVDVGPRRAAGG